MKWGQWDSVRGNGGVRVSRDGRTVLVGMLELR